jgi:hypothetical protein
MPEHQSKFRFSAASQGDFSLRNLAVVGALAVLALLIMGYHPGLEDDSFYLAAIKHDLNPALFPHDADFFRVQFQATIFDKMVAFSIRLSHLPIGYVVLLWQIAAVFFVLHGCWRISRRCFSRPEAQWAATMLIAALLTMPLPGIAIIIADQYLHPRTIATALILAAIVAVIDNKPRLAGVLLVFAVVTHAIMASFGISFCVFLWWNLRGRKMQFPSTAAAVLAFPLAWLVEPASDAWRQAAATRGFYFLGRWHWYEWLGVVAPLVILFVTQRALPHSNENSTLLSLVSATLRYGIFQTIVGLLVMFPPALERLRPFEPMRYLQLLYVVFLLIVGGLLGQFVLERRVYRWALLFIPLSAGMVYAQRQMYFESRHLELPWTVPSNPWTQAFSWIRHSTPTDALFALDPHYQTLPGEDQHGFRALAERSALADYEKDAGMAARVPSLAPRWLREVTALDGWGSFHDSDFQRLEKEFGVNWMLLSRADKQYSLQDSATVTCPYENEDVKVCRLR